MGSIWYQLDEWAKTATEIGMGVTEIPEASSLRENVGANTGVAREFRSEVGSVARELGRIVTIMTKELIQTEESVRLALADMLETDAELADEAQEILTLVDSAIERGQDAGKPSAAASPTPNQPPSSAPEGTGGVDAFGE